jgi:hypothetical protein
MTLQLHDRSGMDNALRSWGRMPVGAARLRRLASLLERDIAHLPLDAQPPAEVAEAAAAYRAAVAWALQAAGAIETAQDQAKAAASKDVAAVAAAVKDGRPRPRLGQVKAAGDVSAAVVECEAAEQLLKEAHGALIDAVAASWSVWRDDLLDSAAVSHAEATTMLDAATAAVKTASRLYTAMGELDVGVAFRVPEMSDRVDASQVEFTTSADGLQPLRHVALRQDNRAPVMFPIADVLSALAEAVALPGEMSADDYDDSDFDAPQDGDGEQDSKRREQLVKWQHEGYPPQPAVVPQGLNGEAGPTPRLDA